MKKLVCKLALAICSVVATSVAFAADASIQSIAGYEILEYLESSGTQYIDTGVVYANDTKLTQRFCVVNFNKVQMWMGALDTVSDAYHRFHWGVRGNVENIEYQKAAGTGNPEKISDSDVGSDGWVNLVLDATSQNANNYSESVHSSIGLFGRNSGGIFTCGSFRVGQTCIWKGGNLVRNMVPVRRISDGVLGLYDYCESKFYENEGEGEFVAGPAMKYMKTTKVIPDSVQSLDSPIQPYCPLPVVKDNTGKVLRKDVDYTLAWTDNDRFGVGTCIISGAGDYANVLPVHTTFLIAPKAKLPQEFERLFYLESTGTEHYIDTDIHPTLETRITALVQTTANATAHIVGIIDDVFGMTGKRFHLTAKAAIGGIFMTGGVGSNESQDVSASSPLKLDAGWNKLTLDAPNQTLSVNDGTASLLGTGGTLPTVSTLRIFGRASNNQSYSVANPVRIADVEIYESGVKTHEFIPCRRKADGVLGLYDTVAKKFCVNSGSAEGGFVAGPELNLADANRGFIILVR